MLRGPGSVHQLVWREAIVEEGRIAYLLQGNGVELKLRASSNDARQLALEAKTNVQSAESQRFCRTDTKWGGR